MNQNALEIWQLVANEKQARLKLDNELRSHLSSKLKDLELYLLTSKEIFWTSQLNLNNWEVRAKWNITICSNYFEGKCDRPDKCAEVHICKDYLFGDNYCKWDDCHFSHDITDSHNLTVLQSLNVPIININVIRNSFPRLCSLLLDTGKCTKKFCGYLHLCYKYLKSHCNPRTCSLASKSGIDNAHDLQSQHNQLVLEQFNLYKKKEKTIKDNILICPIAKAVKKNFSMCKFYIDGNCNMEKRCKHLHICKDFLLPIKRCLTDKCEKRLSHNPFDEHNKPIVAERKLLHLKKEEVAKLLKESFPKICRAYQRKEQCCRCNRIHICPNYSEGGCENRKCNLSHDYKDEHNGNVLSSYGFGALLKPKVKDEYIKVNILSSFGSLKQTSVAATRAFLPNRKGALYRQVRGDTIPVHRGNRIINQPYIPRVRSPDRDLPVQLDRTRLSAKISKEDVFDFIINTFDSGYAEISEADEPALFELISREKSNFRLLRHKNEKISVSVYDINIEPCHQFWSENGCDGEDCGRFHICKRVILQIPHNKHTCKFSHEFSTSGNDKLIEENDLANLTNEQILVLLRNRYPKVCKEYQTNQCTEGIDICQKLHVCLNLVIGNCKKSEAICGLLHENGLRGSQSARLIQEFNLEKDCFPMCLYYEDISITPSFTTDGSTFNGLKEEAVCSSYISGTCNKKTCHLIHTRFNSQYVWQERKKGAESWEDCQQANSEKFEKAFCDPNLDYFEYKSYRIRFAEDVNGVFLSSACDVEFRRLSTKSSVLGKSNENYLTQWKWYWKRGDNDWSEYKNGISSSQIEMTYLKANGGLPASPIKFSTNQFPYEIDFVKMKQKNLDATYGTEREIRRRPVFSSVIVKNPAQNHFSVPSHWPSTCKPGSRIPISDQALLSKLKASFTTSIGSHLSIFSIEEVCNVNLFQLYQSKKMLMEKNGASSNEKWLFHGFSSTVLNEICAQNLDWRLNGLNGTVYGQGTYFARDSSYSNSYSTPDSSGYKYMFIAQVLVGQFTKGSSSYKRPPVRDHSTSELFDSVVNNVSNPSIFVIFDQSQCYPRYLVKYK